MKSVVRERKPSDGSWRTPSISWRAVSRRTRSRRICMPPVSWPAVLDVDAILRPYWDALIDHCGPLALYDAHTHLGGNDPDGMKQRPEELLRVLDSAGDARAVTFP